MNERNSYKPFNDKTRESALANLFMNEFGFLGGPSVIDLIVTKVLELVDSFTPPLSTVKPGQVVWLAVDKREKNTHQKGMDKTKLVPVVLTLVSSDDIAELTKGEKLIDVRMYAIARMLNEAYEQGGLLSHMDISLLMHLSQSEVSKQFRRYLEKHEVLPYRGTLHDLGPTTTHKAKIVAKNLEGKQPPDIARETYHSMEAVETYIQDYNRVKMAVDKEINEEEISRIVKLSPKLVEEYLILMKEYEGRKVNVENEVRVRKKLGLE